MNLNLQGKKVFITGSSKGIGFEIARSFLEENCEVIINGRNKKSLLLAKKKLLKAKIILGDVAKKNIAKNIIKYNLIIFSNIIIIFKYFNVIRNRIRRSAALGLHLGESAAEKAILDKKIVYFE